MRLPSWLTTAAGMAVMAALGLATFDVLPLWPRTGSLSVAHPGRAEVKAAAAEARMRRAARAIDGAKRQAGLPSEAGGLVEDTALLGSELTPFVTTLGSLEAKRLAARPAWARALTTELDRAGVGPGSIVAANFSGSFPGINLAVVCATQELGARLLAVTSVTASTWGATDAGFTWPELEVRLVRLGIIRPASVAVTIGGDGDRGLDLEEDARHAAAVIARTSAAALGARFLEPGSYQEAVRLRVRAINDRRGTRPVSVFINVGGAEAGMGHAPAILRMQNGWLSGLPAGMADDGGLIGYMAARGTPVLHMLNVRELAVRWEVR